MPAGLIRCCPQIVFGVCCFGWAALRAAHPNRFILISFLKKTGLPKKRGFPGKPVFGDLFTYPSIRLQLRS